VSAGRSSELWEAFLLVRHRLIRAWTAEGMAAGDIEARLSVDVVQVRGIADYDSSDSPKELDREANVLERELEHIEQELDECRPSPAVPVRGRAVVVPGVDLEGLTDDERDRAMSSWLFGEKPAGVDTRRFPLEVPEWRPTDQEPEEDEPS